MSGRIEMTMGKKPAKQASKELSSKASSKPEKTVAASDLSQDEKTPKKK